MMRPEQGVQVPTPKVTYIEVQVLEHGETIEVFEDVVKWSLSDDHMLTVVTAGGKTTTQHYFMPGTFTDVRVLSNYDRDVEA